MRPTPLLLAPLLLAACAVEPAPVVYAPPRPVVVPAPIAPAPFVPGPVRADAACVDALSRTAAVPPGAVRVTSVRPAPGGSIVTMIVGGRRGSWACRADRVGNVVNVAPRRF